jgi:hypothetical protein
MPPLLSSTTFVVDDTAFAGRFRIEVAPLEVGLTSPSNLVAAGLRNRELQQIHPEAADALNRGRLRENPVASTATISLRRTMI